MESAPDALVITDRVGRIQMVNRQAEKLFGYTRRELVGETVEMLMPQAYRHAHAARHGQYSDEPTNRPMGGGASFPARRKDGSQFPAEIGLSPLQTAEGMLVCSVIRDITERKKAENAIRTLNAELEERVVARTAALQKAVESLGQAIEERKRLEKEVLAISEIERRNIGQDLHDDLGQQLAGLWFLSSTLAKSLRPVSSAQAESVANIAAQLDKALTLTRSLARGLQPVAPESGGLMAALRELASRSSELFKLHCRLVRRSPVLVQDSSTATHLYRIAQDAVTNAARHGHAKHITILLSSSAGELLLSVNDDGCGMKETTGKHDGMGIRTMRYRAEAMGGSLEFRPRAEGGTTVTCKIPFPSQPEPENH
jgi:PAS domain S-box-containing protein